MDDLEDELELLKDLDTLRRESTQLWDQGCKDLVTWVTSPPVRGGQSRRSTKSKAFLSRAEYPIVASALYRAGRDVPLRLLRVLERTSLGYFGRTSVDVDVMAAAGTMQALAAAPSSAFCPGALASYYWIVRELYTTKQPEGLGGGVMFGKGGFATAFSTSKCIQALLGFARAQENTATLIRELAAARVKVRALAAAGVPQEWAEAEKERLGLSFYTTIQQLSRNLALDLKLPRSLGETEAFIQEAPSRFKKGIQTARDVFAQAGRRIKVFRKREEAGLKKEGKQRAIALSQSGHDIALTAVQRAQKNAADALALVSLRAPEADRWQMLERAFRDAEKQVRDLLRPARSYVSAILDRELTAASTGGEREWDASELASAAVSYGAVTGAWDDERLVLAAGHLSRSLSAEGRFPVGRPIHSTKAGTIQPYEGVAIGAFAQLLEHIPKVELTPKLAARLLRFFKDTRVGPTAESPGGWGQELKLDSPAVGGTTAGAVLALSRINRMLNERLNGMVFSHFSVKPPEGGATLETLFYSDYGLRLAPTPRPETLAILLQRMRAHVLGVRLPRDDWKEPLYSVVLHGPPGTGKTTLLEALAESCHVPRIDVTPSDIVIRGEESIERRTRAVFQALALVTRAVIILDEFEPVLRKRKSTDTSPPSVFSFLTPGMLPKLKNLNECARERGVCFGLVTNLIGELDRAAIREGRFDRKVGVYPPDVLSRIGRLQMEIRRSGNKMVKPTAKRAWDNRILTVVRETAGAGMPSLGRKGWFRAIDSPNPGTAMHYVLKGGPLPKWPEREAPADLLGSESDAEREFREWAWVEDWDEVLKKNPPLTLNDAVRRRPTKFRDLPLTTGPRKTP